MALNPRQRRARRKALAAEAEKKLALKKAAKKRKAEEKTVERAWSKTARSALDLGYDQPVNRQAAKDLKPARPNSN